MILKNIENFLAREFKPKFFNQSDINNLLTKIEDELVLVVRSKNNQKIYNTFDEDFTAYLTKLPASTMKKQVQQIFNRQLVYFGPSKNRDFVINSRALVSKNEKLVGIVLNSYALDININTGSTPQIDEAIYATYYGLVRAATVINKQEIKKDYELHKLVTSFIFLLFLRIFGKNLNVMSSSQKTLLQLLCIYVYFKQFFDERHTHIINLIEKKFVGDIINKSDYENYKVSIEKFAPYTSFKDIPRALIDFNLSNVSQQQLMMLIIKYVDKSGFYALIGSLDYLIASIIVSKYPTEIISKGFIVNSEIQNRVEQIFDKYINKLSYESIFTEKEITEV